MRHVENWRCLACGSEGYRGYCCDSVVDGNRVRYNHRVPVVGSDWTDEEIVWALPAGPTSRHILIDREAKTVHDCGLAVDVRLGIFGPECRPVKAGPVGPIVAVIA